MTARMEDPAAQRPGDELDPDIALFRRQAGEATRHLPPLDTLPLVEARHLIELARAPWSAGGPTMHRSRDIMLDEAPIPLRLRIHEPMGETAGTLVYVHGGGWTLFSLETHDRLMREYAVATGLVVMGIDYALAPEAAYPVAIGQITQALQLLQAEPGRLGLEPGPIFIGGDSAGANLSIASALVLRDAGEPSLLSGLLLNYGVYDHACTGPSFDRYTDPAYMLTREEMDFFWTHYIPDPGQRGQALASPLRAELGGLPPCFLAIAQCDVLADENVAMARRLDEAGVATRSVTYGGTTHSFLEAISIAAVARQALQDQADWVRTRLAAA